MIEVVNTPATIEATMTLTPPQPADLLQNLMKLLDEHIEKKIADALAKHLDAVRDVAREVANEVAEAVLTEHTDEYDHDDYDRAYSNLDQIINDAIYDYDFDDKVADAISSFDMEDKIKDTIRDLTFSISVE
jgi:hypothetical protein